MRLSGWTSKLAVRACMVSMTLLCLALAGSGCSERPDLDHEVISYDITPYLMSGLQVDASFDPGVPGCGHLMGEGWHEPTARPGSIPHAWTRAPRATFTLPVAHPGAGHIYLHGYGLKDGTGPRTVSLVVNGHDLGRQSLPRSLSWLSFPVPPDVLRARENTVELITERVVRPADVTISQDQRELGIFVDCVLFLPAGDKVTVPDHSPFTTIDKVELDGRRSLRLSLVQPGGARLRLRWSATDTTADNQLVLAAAAGTDSEPGFTASVTLAERKGEHVWDLPADLPPMTALNVRLQGPRGGEPTGPVVLTEASLHWDFRPLNVVLIVVDTLRPDYLGCYGDPRGRSPGIDRLAADGILFENAFAHTPITGPSHAALFTARFPSETGVLNNGMHSLSPDQPLLAEILQEHGYGTGAAVSLPPLTHKLGFDRGFAVYRDSVDIDLMITAETLLPRTLAALSDLQPPFFWLTHFCDPHAPYNAHGLVQRSADLYVDGERLATIVTSAFAVQKFDLELGAGPTSIRVESSDAFQIRRLQVRGEGGQHPSLSPEVLPTDPVTSLTCEIGSDGSRQASLILGLSDFIAGGEELDERYSREVAHVDRHVAALLDTLDARGWYDESLIIFTSDHGEALGEKGHIGHIHSLYDPLLRIPLIIKPPRSTRERGGQRRTDLASLVDIMPTILSMLDITPSAYARGRDLLARKAEKVDASLFCETHAPQAFHTLYGLRDSRHKIIFTPDADRYEVYDLAADPQEDHDLSLEENSLVGMWRHRLAEFRTGLDLRSEAEAEVVVDEETQRQLRALGY